MGDIGYLGNSIMQTIEKHKGAFSGKLEYIGWKVTPRCNLNCPFCYAEEDNPTELCLEALKVGFNNLKSAGFRAINITGGEPMLRDDIIEICDYVKSLGFIVMMSSNGTLIKDMEIFNGRLDWLSLSLDGISTTDSNVYTHQEPQKIIDLIKTFSVKKHDFGLKINTLVTQENKKILCDIGSLLEKLGTDLKWKLIKVAPRGRAKMQQGKIDISLDEFLDLAEFIKTKFRALQVSYWPSNPNYLKAYYLIINSEGRIMLPIDNRYICRGSVFSKDVDQIFTHLKHDYSEFVNANSTYLFNSYGGK